MDIGMPPAQPPQVAQQTGLASVTPMVRPQPGQAAQPGGGPQGSPTGDLAIKGEAVRRVIGDMAKDPNFEPYAKRILALLDTGLQAAAGGAQGGAPQPDAGSPDGGGQGGAIPG